MNQVFWIGVYPGLTEEMLAFVTEMFVKFTGRSNPKSEARNYIKEDVMLIK
jgi:hypothetical protein